MKKSLLIAILLIPMMSFAQSNRAQNYINNSMKTDPNLQDAIVGILAVDKNDNVIASWNPDMPMLTASTMKTITTGLGYRVLGPDFRFSTRIAYDGKIADGVLNGNLYIVGGADPTLASKDTIAFPIDSIFGIWAQAVKDAGIQRINGKIIGDDRIYDDENIPDSWTYGNAGYDYGSGTTGLNFCENLSYFRVAPGVCEGDQLEIESLYAVAPEVIILTDETTTGAPKSGDRTVYYASDLAPFAKFAGSYPIDRPADTVGYSNKHPQSTCAWEFAKFLKGSGVSSKGSISIEEYDNNFAPTAQEDLTYIAETFSPELRRIVKVTNTISNNFFAETIYKMVGKTLIEKAAGKPVYGITYGMADRAINKYFEENGVSTAGYTQDDGSGLSRENYVSPRFFCRFYKFMQSCPDFQEYFDSFPGPGRPGTLKGVLAKADPKIKATIHAKSGSLSSVRCYAGYVDSKRGMIRFAILTNNYSCYTSTVQPKIEGFMEELAKYGNKQ